MMGFVWKPFVETVFWCISILSGLSGETGSLYMFDNDQMSSKNNKWNWLFYKKINLFLFYLARIWRLLLTSPEIRVSDKQTVIGHVLFFGRCKHLLFWYSTNRMPQLLQASKILSERYLSFWCDFWKPTSVLCLLSSSCFGCFPHYFLKNYLYGWS